MSLAGLRASFPGVDVESDLEQLVRMGKLRMVGELVTTSE
jgi:hypothetical protein